MASSPHMAPGPPWPPDNASLLEWAEAWHDRGYKVIPLRGKRPVDNDWPTILFGNNLALHFGGRNGKRNVGVALGESRLCDIDLDCPEATMAWCEFFGPRTNLIYGRDSKAYSHWFYHLRPPISTKRYQIVSHDPTTGKRKARTILELRCLNAQQAVGLQSMVPGSIHPTAKERIRFEAGGDGAPADVAADVLTLAAGRTAAAVLLAWNFPAPQGGRHDTFLGLSGFLLHNSGWPVDDIVQFHCAIYRLLWLQNANFADARTEVETTASQISQGQSVTGFPRLADLIDLQVLRKALSWLNLKTDPRSQTTGPTIITALGTPSSTSGTASGSTPHTAPGMPRGFRLVLNGSQPGVYFYPDDPDEAPIFVCSPLEVISVAADRDGATWSRLARWRDLEGREQHEIIPMELLDEAAEYRKILHNRGLLIATGRKGQELL